MARYATMAISLLIGIALARSLAPVERGAYAVALTLTALPAIAAGAGLETAVLRSVNPDDRADVFGLVARRVIGVSLATLILILIVVVGRIDFFGLTATPLAVCLISVPFVVAVQLYGNAVLGLQRWGAWAVATVANSLAYMGLTLGIAATGRAGVVPYQFAFLAGYIVALGCLTRVVWRQSHSICVSRSSVVARTASRASVITISQALFMRIQVPLLQVTSGTAAVGVLAVASPVADILLVLPVAAGTVLLPRYYATKARETDVRRNALRIATVTALIGVAAAVAAPWLIPLMYGVDYAQASRVLQIMVPGVVLFSYARVIQSFLISSSRYARVIFASVMSIIVSIVVQVIVSPILGALGSAVAISAGYATMFVIIATVRRREDVTA